MKTAGIRELRNTYNDLLRWIEAGEEVVIQRRGKPVARLVPEKPHISVECDWAKSPASLRDKSTWPKLGANDAQKAVHEASGKW